MFPIHYNITGSKYIDNKSYLKIYHTTIKYGCYTFVYLLHHIASMFLLRIEICFVISSNYEFRYKIRLTAIVSNTCPN